MRWMMIVFWVSGNGIWVSGNGRIVLAVSVLSGVYAVVSKE